MKQIYRAMLVAVMAMMTVALIGCGDKDNNGDDTTNTGDGEKLTLTASGVQFTMVRVEPGTFMMGPIEGDTSAYDREMPAHQVTLTKPYYIAETDVTQELYQAVMGVNPSQFTFGANLPVERVSYTDAMTFCEQLSSKTGCTFTLPTEAQWEYAARGGHKAPATPTLYAGSNNIDEVAWYIDNSDGRTHAVRTKAPNELGLYDMTGNVWEWCLEWYSNYTADAQTDPAGSAEGTERVCRGSCWYRPAVRCRISMRDPSADDTRVNLLGFRVVMLP